MDIGGTGRGYWGDCGDLEMLVGYWKVLGGVAWDTGDTGILGSNGSDWVGYWGYWEGMDEILVVMGRDIGILGSTGKDWLGYWG